MDRFLKKHKLDTDEETQGLRQSVKVAASSSNATTSKLPRNGGIDLQVKMFDNIVKPTQLWDLLGLETQTALYLSVLFVERS